ncbi:MAG: 50S ribosomal protein L18 [Nanoarchaeota archaeon]|nr:50S ribosomal protein L18 [Nanoarchaeota archaeon]MBU1704662.1 50S ribosomal protein L18 [Nanoarchaeota archaeon]
MTTNKQTIIQFRRKREGKTNYKKRLKLLMAKKPRLCVRISLKTISAQIIEYAPDGDKVIGSVNSSSLTKLGIKSTGNTPSAYLTGLMVGKLAKEKGVNEMILDIGFRKPVKGSKVYAVLKGALDAGIEIPHSDDIIPSEDRLNGKNIKGLSDTISKIKTQILGK